MDKDDIVSALIVAGVVLIIATVLVSIFGASEFINEELIVNSAAKCKSINGDLHSFNLDGGVKCIINETIVRVEI